MELFEHVAAQTDFYDLTSFYMRVVIKHIEKMPVWGITWYKTLGQIYLSPDFLGRWTTTFVVNCTLQLRNSWKIHRKSLVGGFKSIPKVWLVGHWGRHPETRPAALCHYGKQWWIWDYYVFVRIIIPQFICIISFYEIQYSLKKTKWTSMIFPK